LLLIVKRTEGTPLTRQSGTITAAFFRVIDAGIGIGLRTESRPRKTSRVDAFSVTADISSPSTIALSAPAAAVAAAAAVSCEGGRGATVESLARLHSLVVAIKAGITLVLNILKRQKYQETSLSKK